jgi:hypothetical protein
VKSNYTYEITKGKRIGSLIGGRMKRIAAISVFVLLAGCGSAKISLNNGTGMDLETVTLTVGDNTETWQNIKQNQTFSSSIAVTENSVPVVIVWETGGQQWRMDNLLIDSATEAKKISILFEADELSINYSF